MGERGADDATYPRSVLVVEDESLLRELIGQASGATNTIRELGGVMGIAILATAFSAAGSYSSPQTFVDGASAAMPIGAAVLVVGVIAALLVPRAGGEGGPVGSASPG